MEHRVNQLIFLIFKFIIKVSTAEYSECQDFCQIVRIGSPHPLTPRGVLLSPLWVQEGEGRGGGTQFDEGTYTVVLYVL
jgi:hypothetical protein